MYVAGTIEVNVKEYIKQGGSICSSVINGLWNNLDLEIKIFLWEMFHVGREGSCLQLPGLTAHQSSGQHCPQVRTGSDIPGAVPEHVDTVHISAVPPRFGSGSSRACSKLWAVHTFPSLVQLHFLPAPSHLHSCSSLALLQNWAVSQKEPSSLRFQTLE